MSHHCKALIIHCIDFRFGKAIKKILENQGILGDCDIISVAGAVKNLVSPSKPYDVEFVLRQIDISKRLHDVQQIILLNHTDCAAYGGREAFASDEEEFERSRQDLKKAEELIQAKYPDLEIKTILAKIQPSNQITFQEI